MRIVYVQLTVALPGVGVEDEALTADLLVVARWEQAVLHRARHPHRPKTQTTRVGHKTVLAPNGTCNVNSNPM